MKKQPLTIVVKIALGTTLAIVLYELTSQLLIYKYIRFDYYISAAVVLSLAVGVLLSRKTAAISSPMQDPVNQLTPKEYRILEMIAEGKTNKEIAALCYVELSTVKTHTNNIFSKLAVKNRREAAILFRNHVSTQKSTISPPGLS